MALELGARIRRFRRERGMTQTDLADRSGVSFRAIQKIEDGTSMPKADTVQMLAQSLGIGVSSLFDEVAPSATLSPLCSKAPTVDDVAALVGQFAKVSPSRRSVALAILFDDVSLAPEVEAFLAQYDSEHPKEA